MYLIADTRRVIHKIFGNWYAEDIGLWLPSVVLCATILVAGSWWLGRVFRIEVCQQALKMLEECCKTDISVPVYIG